MTGWTPNSAVLASKSQFNNINKDRQPTAPAYKRDNALKLTQVVWVREKKEPWMHRKKKKEKKKQNKKQNEQEKKKKKNKE